MVKKQIVQINSSASLLAAKFAINISLLVSIVTYAGKKKKKKVDILIVFPLSFSFPLSLERFFFSTFP